MWSDPGSVTIAFSGTAVRILRVGRRYVGVVSQIEGT